MHRAGAGWPAFAPGFTKSCILWACLLWACAAHAQGSASKTPADCGSPLVPCQMASGNYHALAPDGPASTPRPIIVHFHGAGGAGKQVIASKWLTAPFLDSGFVFVAPNGAVRSNGRTGWNFRANEGHRRNELAFTREVIADVARRFNGDPARVLLTGHSIGGSLVWYLACEAPETFAAYAAVAGGFWRPHPARCQGPVNMLHVHGWNDGVVPLEGRTFARPGFTARQGDILEGLQIWRQVNGCRTQAPQTIQWGKSYGLRSWHDCAPGTRLDFVLHSGGHEIPAFWPRLAIDWFANSGWNERPPPSGTAAR